MPLILHEIVRDTLAGEPDITLAGGPVSNGDLEAAMARHRVDVVITGEGTPGAIALCERLARQHPSVRVISLPGDGRDANALERRVCVTSLGNLSPAQLVAAIRRDPGSSIAPGSSIPEHP
jgi:hypothetical protein